MRMPAFKKSITIVGVLGVLCGLWVGIDAAKFFGLINDYREEGSAFQVPPWPSSAEEAIVVLTGERGRIPSAIELLRSRPKSWLIVSGAGKGITKTELLNQQGNAAVNAQETWKRIEVESEANSTVENALESAKFLSSRKIHDVILVTSYYHMPRSLEIFKRVYPKVTYWPYPVVPAISGLEIYSKSLFEFIKYFVFHHFVALHL